MHLRDCECFVCKARRQGESESEAMAGIEKFHKESLEKEGWYAHYVSDDHYPLGLNAHTHGLENYEHVNFQIVCPLKMETAHSLFRKLADQVKAGHKFQHNDYLEEFTKGYKFKLVMAFDDRRSVLRLIVPDRHGNLEPDNLTEGFERQYEDLIDE